MGGSESKFRPKPQDVWYNFRSMGRQPKLLQSVMQAIVDLKGIGDVSVDRIIEYLKGLVICHNKQPRPKSLTTQIRNALAYAVENELVKEKNGKFSLCLDARNFAIFKSFKCRDPIFGESRLKRTEKPVVFKKKSKPKKKATEKKRKCKPSVKPTKD